MSALIDLDKLAFFLRKHDLSEYVNEIINACKASNANRHGGLEKWLAVVNNLPTIKAEKVNLFNGVKFHNPDCGTYQRQKLEQQLMELAPWRKGPFELFGVHIDTEWRSDLKWQRVSEAIDLQDKRILDVGCGNGYYMLRMLGAGARYVMGVDPVPLYVVQFMAVNKFLRSEQVQLLPIGLEAMPVMPVFDTVFSMGVLYHRRDPFDHLNDLKKMLTQQGELIMETLVIESDDDSELIPEDRYAGMKNVWSIPSVMKLKYWLKQSGFENIEVLDVSQTTLQEQRQTDWMRSHSLNQFLNPNDHNLTVEGYPAPVRAMIRCSVQH